MKGNVAFKDMGKGARFFATASKAVEVNRDRKAAASEQARLAHLRRN